MDESRRVTEILQQAIRMEEDGREFYLKAAEQSRDPLASDLFRTLAEEEIGHQLAVRSIYDELQAGNDWPERNVPAVHAGKAESIFSAAMKNPQKLPGTSASDLEAVRTALDMEERSFRLYRDRSEEASTPGEVQFYQALAAEERGHISSLRDTEEYLTDPEGWFMQKQRVTLDGAS